MKRSKPPYPFLAHEAGPRPGKVWGYWRFTGPHEPPELSWWWHMEPNRREAQRAAKAINRWRQACQPGWPKAFAAQVRVGP